MRTDPKPSPSKPKGKSPRAAKLETTAAHLSRLAAIVESSSDAFVSKDLNGIVVSWNKSAEEMFGYTAEEMIGTSIVRLIPEDRRHEEELILDKIRRGEVLKHFETVRRTRDGRLIDVSVTVSPVKDASGRIVGASKVARDITEQKRMAVGLNSLAAIVESSSDAILSEDLSGTVVSWNQSAEEMFGYTADEMLGTSISWLIPEDRRHEEDLILDKVRKGEVMRHFETVRRTKDGRLIDVSVTASPVKDASGQVVGASLVARDITEQKRMELGLSRLAAIVESSSDAIVSKDLNGNVTTWNKRAEEMFGYTAEEMLGTSILRLIPEDRKDEEELILTRIRRGEVMRHFETVRRTKDGRLIDVSVTVSPVKDASGRIVGASKVARDITEHKRMEETRRQIRVLDTSNQGLHQEITRRVAVEKALLKSQENQKRLQERTKQLAQQVLQTQEQERLRISRELHDVVVQMLIGLNVHLAALRAKVKEATPEFQRQLAHVRQLVEDSVETVHRFARDLRPSALEELGFVPTLQAFTKAFGQGTGIRVELDIFQGIERLDASILTAFYRVIQEALQNVARHSGADTVELSIRKAEDGIFLTIRDNGKGFEDESEKSKNAKDRKRLGLLGMQERLEILGGSLEIESAPNKGTLLVAQVPWVEA